MIDEGAAAFHEDGYVVLDSVFDVAVIKSVKEKAIQNYEKCRAKITKNGWPEIGIGIKFGYKEIVQRQALRFEMPYQMDSKDFDFVLESDKIKRLVSGILQCEDYCVINRSLVISLPGSTDQSWHSDGPHVSMSSHLPCHCLNIANW